MLAAERLVCKMEHVILGWERFFEELAAFIRDLNRQAGVANESYCEYACERLALAVSTH